MAQGFNGASVDSKLNCGLLLTASTQFSGLLEKQIHA